MARRRTRESVTVSVRFPEALVLIVLVTTSACTAGQDSMDFEAARKNMVELQILKRDVRSEPVIAAMLKVPRHEFTPESLRLMAYSDQPLPIGEGQTISQPYIVALMTELLELKSTDRVLEIGTGSGYQAAVLAEITPQVFTIEIVDVLAKRAEMTLRKLGYQSIAVKSGDGFLGWEEYSPFNAIIITCATPEIPKPLVAQLAEGGRLVAPVDVAGGYQSLRKYVKVKDELHASDIIDVRFVPMTGDSVDKLKKEAK